jgi:hypothetical protein
MPNKFLAHAMVAAAVGTAGLGMEAMRPPTAMALSFNFSFTNTANGGGAVTGLVQGLTDNATSAATSVQVLSNTAGFGLGEYIGNPLSNSWTVSGGTIQSYNFSSVGSSNFLPAVTDSSLGFFTLPSGKLAGLTNDPDRSLSRLDTRLTFAAAPIPTPALLPGLVGMSLALLRKRQAAAVQVSAAG